MKSGIRIIGGRWRGRKLEVIDVEGLRPTPDRIRETLFNWLAPDCPGARVLDCFAGSGVLGFEALSRGACHLVALERDRAALECMQGQATALQADAIDIVGGDAMDSIQRLSGPFDIVFIDPPYVQPELRVQVFTGLEASGCLQPGTKVYFEWPGNEAFELPSSNLSWLQRKRAGQVNYAIAEWRVSR